MDLTFKWLVPIARMTARWGQAENSVDYRVKDSLSPVNCVCKCISKLDGWSELALSYLPVKSVHVYTLCLVITFRLTVRISVRLSDVLPEVRLGTI